MQTLQYTAALARYGRDYAWLPQTLAVCGGRVQTAAEAGCASIAPACSAASPDTAKKAAPAGAPKGEGGGPPADLGVQYGFAPGWTLHFLWEEGPAVDAAVWQRLLAQKQGLFCIPVKTGRPAAGWQAGLQLAAIRPLVRLRPFYIFVRPVSLSAGAAAKTLPLADTRGLGRLLEAGYVGVGQPAPDAVTLRRREALRL